ncbi:hypothetical protein D3C72_2224620 [compost metagenome]
MLPLATELEAVNKEFTPLLTNELIEAIAALIPDEWLKDEDSFESPEEHRQAYIHFLTTRIAQSDIFVKAAEDAREGLI